MKHGILSILALVGLLTAPAAFAQGNQPPTWVWARDYAGWSLVGQQPNTFTFNGGACNYTPYNDGNTPGFFIFSGKQGGTTVYYPVAILDANPALSEIVTPTSTRNGEASCGFSAATVNRHTSFTLVDGTAGLQPAIATQLQSAPIFNVMLDKSWYQRVAGLPGSPSGASIIAAVQGNANVSIVDTTTTPWTWYGWNGNEYAVVGGGSLAALGLVAGVAGPNYFFGDSTVAPIGSGDSGTSLQMANRLSNDMLGQKFSYAVAGTTIPAISAAVFTDFPVNFNTTSNLPKIYIEAGINDANTQTATTGVINNFSLTYNSMVSWPEMPVSNRVYASTATAAGTWTTSNAFPLHASNATFGGERQSTTNASTLTFSIPSAGAAVGITYGAVATNGGTFTFSIDGVLQTDVCSGTTTFSNTGCNASTLNGNSLFRQQFAVSVGTHTGVVTVTSATSASNVVYITAVDVIPATTAGQPFMLASGVIEQASNANAANTLAFDNAQAAVIASLPWANVLRVDVRNGTPGVNSTTDMATNTTLCTGGVSPLHPNSCGYQHWVQTVEGTAATVGWNIFFPGLGVNPSTINTPLTVQGAVTAGVPLPGIGDALGSFQVATQGAGTTLTAATPNVLANQIPTATLFAQPTCFFPTATNTVCVGFTFDAVRAQLAEGLISQYEMGFQHCPAAVTGGPTACRWDLFSDPVSGLVTPPQGLAGPATAPTGTCPTIGAWIFSQDGHATFCPSNGGTWATKI